GDLGKKIIISKASMAKTFTVINQNMINQFINRKIHNHKMQLNITDIFLFAIFVAVFVVYMITYQSIPKLEKGILILKNKTVQMHTEAKWRSEVQSKGL